MFTTDSPLADKSELLFEDLQNERIITLHPKFVPFEHSNIMRDKILEHELHHMDMHCENDQVGILYAECGYGVGIFPEFCISSFSDRLAMRPFERKTVTYDYGVAYHKNDKNKVLKYFLDVCANSMPVQKTYGGQ